MERDVFCAECQCYYCIGNVALSIGQKRQVLRFPNRLHRRCLPRSGAPGRSGRAG